MFDHVVNSNNDDDIFDDSKTLSGESSSTATSSPNSFIGLSTNDLSNESLNKAIGSFFEGVDVDGEQLENLIKHIESEHGVKVENLIGNLRYQFVDTFYSAVHKWLMEYRIDETPQSIYSALTVLTENRFPLYHKFYNIELNIAKCFTILKFLNKTFISKDDNSMEILSKVFKSQLDERYIKTYFESVKDILDFTIVQETALYIALGNELDLTIRQDILDRTASVSEIASSSFKDLSFANALTPNMQQVISLTLSEQMKSFYDTENK